MWILLVMYDLNQFHVIKTRLKAEIRCDFVLGPWPPGGEIGRPLREACLQRIRSFVCRRQVHGVQQ